MSEWKEVKLGEIAKLNQSTYSSKDNWEFANYLDTGNITENRISEIQFIDLTKEELPSRAKKKVRKDSIIRSYFHKRQSSTHAGSVDHGLLGGDDISKSLARRRCSRRPGLTESRLCAERPDRRGSLAGLAGSLEGLTSFYERWLHEPRR